jgi:hypothetical protein
MSQLQISRTWNERCDSMWGVRSLCQQPDRIVRKHPILTENLSYKALTTRPFYAYT